MDIVVATKNKGKIREIKKILQGHNVMSQDEVGIFTDVEETGTSFAENAFLKAREVAKHTKCAVIADDSGLEVDALGGAPGIYSARYGGEGLTDEDRVERLLEEMKDKSDRGAQFACAMALVMANGQEHLFEGVVRGTLLYEPQGANGFGYDPVFVPDGYNDCFGILESSIKNEISHRAKALKLLADFLTERN